jgi:hypothetical protein
VNFAVSSSATTVRQFQPRSRVFPARLLDQPFYGWEPTRNEFNQPASAGFSNEALAKSPVGMTTTAKQLIRSTLKRANSSAGCADPALEALV